MSSNPFELIRRELPDTSELATGNTVAWRSPSNIALVKYWGKHGKQLPRNPSLSFSLTNAHTETAISYQTKPRKSKGVELSFSFEGKPNAAFENRIQDFLDGLVEIFPFLDQLSLTIESKNSFPHSSGIASSASSMSALALCLVDIEYALFRIERDHSFLRKASYIARLGSGSASRSVYEGFCIWGKSNVAIDTSDEYAVPLQNSHSIFKNLHDDILIVSASEKAVSSSAGHRLMETNPFAETRYEQAHNKLEDLTKIIELGDIESFGKIVEEEAMTLHALMMCSDPSYVLMEPASLSVINEIRSYRKSTGIPIYFTLDAGPNVHVIYPDQVKVKASKFVNEVLSAYCENSKNISDQMGKGPLKIK